MSSPQVWFVTGSSSGFGRSMVEAALKKGHLVAATLRKPEVLEDLAAEYSAAQLLILKLDVTKEDEIAAAFAKVKEVFGRVDIVFNNAGIALIGEIEATTQEVARDSFEVLFWGATNVTRTALEYMRDNKPVGGRILQVSSFYGVYGESGTGYYSAAKFALEGFTESLVKEMDPEWNIKVTIIEPGPFLTGIKGNACITPAHPAYPPLPNGQTRLDPLKIALNGNKDKAVEVFLKIATAPDPPLRLPIHKHAIAFVRKKAASLLADADKSEVWSEDIILPPSALENGGTH
ncbi:NAD-P-binding protein [Crucibulum laeve]|uniref:NAD-P-binding protein n=1 Tax=Crucibulum laeve TaxID=68775 RepID=A0A5C3LKG2_9AGAR|nr:NAD-P-binding protein [Crucibulum laeve]